MIKTLDSEHESRLLKEPPRCREAGGTAVLRTLPVLLTAPLIEPHVAINGTVSKNGKVRKTAVPSEVAASLRYAISQRLRKRIEECFGWGKTVGGLAQLKVRGLDKVRAVFVFGVAAYNLVRLPKLLAPTGEVCPTA